MLYRLRFMEVISEVEKSPALPLISHRLLPRSFFLSSLSYCFQFPSNFNVLWCYFFFF